MKMHHKISLILIVVLTFGVFAGATLASGADEPVTYDDVLSSMHEGQWFGWSDSTAKNYENLIVLDGRFSKPTKPELLAAQAALQNKKIEYNSSRLILDSDRSALEANFLSGKYSDADIVDYLRILGGF